MRIFRSLALVAIVAGGAAGAWQAVEAGNSKDKHARVDDPYIWLEDVHGTMPLSWVKKQNEHALALLTADPQYKSDYDSLLAVLDATDRIPFGNLDHNTVFNLWQDAEHPKGLWRRTTADDYAKPAPHWDVLLDVDKLAAGEKENWVFKGADCAPSLKRCLITLSRGGGDAAVVREFDLKTKTFVADGFSLPEAKSDVTYVDDDRVLFGTDFGKGTLTASGYPRIVKLWKRGQKIADAKTVLEGKSEDVLVAPLVFRTQDGNVPLIVRAVSFFESEYYLPDSNGTWVKLPLPLSVDMKGMTKNSLLFTLRKDWTPAGATMPLKQGSLVALPVDQATKSAAKFAVLYAPGPRASINEVVTGRDAVYAAIYDNVVGSVHVFRPAKDGPAKDSWSDTRLDLPPGGSAHVVSADDYGSAAQFRFESFTAPTTLYADKGDGKPLAIKALPARFDASSFDTQQFEATSKDGTKIPYFVVRAKAASGPSPTLLYGYGGFEIAMLPSYSAGIGKLWLTKGGTYVLANIRGGGEFGPAWHDAALLTHRQRAFDDFAAVAADLVTRGITTPKQLGIIGGSNGGLLVSTVMTQHPELLGAVVCQVPLIDMIRYTKIGAGASWVAEYGDPADKTMRDYIRSYSPYQNVAAEKKYPPVFFVTATSDDRVTPVHARKMAARMLAQGHEVLFYENTDGGHAAAADHKQQAEMYALSYTYLREKLGLKSVAASTSVPTTASP
ncbi:MAG: S9 family peptidase [Proteobacteria bacterium]|nr:S9 family peptidase [Pseudomonadota bacterium]